MLTTAVEKLPLLLVEGTKQNVVSRLNTQRLKSSLIRGMERNASSQNQDRLAATRAFSGYVSPIRIGVEVVNDSISKITSLILNSRVIFIASSGQK